MNNLNNFYKYLDIERKFSKHTLHKYEYVLTQLDNFAKLKLKSIEQLQLNELKQYLLQLVDKKYSKATQAQHISIIKGYFKYLLREEIINENIADGLVYPKLDKKLPSILYESEIFALFESIDTSKKFGKRNLAIITTLYSSGIRVSELANLKVNEFLMFKDNVKVIGKGNKERVVPLNPYTFDVISDYINFERSLLLKNNQSDYLWINNKGERLTERGIRYIINEIVMKSSLLIKVSPHTFRHSFATHLLNACMDIRIVQDLLGHESLSTTEIYTHLDNDNLRLKYEKLNLRR